MTSRSRIPNDRIAVLRARDRKVTIGSECNRLDGSFVGFERPLRRGTRGRQVDDVDSMVFAIVGIVVAAFDVNRLATAPEREMISIRRQRNGTHLLKTTLSNHGTRTVEGLNDEAASGSGEPTASRDDPSAVALKCTALNCGTVVGIGLLGERVLKSNVRKDPQ